jgi:hypothetical protein
MMKTVVLSIVHAWARLISGRPAALPYMIVPLVRFSSKTGPEVAAEDFAPET